MTESAECGAATLDDAAYLGLDEEALTGTVGSTARTPPGVFLTGVYDPDATTGGRVGIAGDGGVELAAASPTRYRLVGSANASIANATADGFVLELSAAYVHVPTGKRVRVAFRYDRLGDTDAIPPAWYWAAESTADGTG